MSRNLPSSYIERFHSWESRTFTMSTDVCRSVMMRNATLSHLSNHSSITNIQLVINGISLIIFAIRGVHRAGPPCPALPCVLLWRRTGHILKILSCPASGQGARVRRQGRTGQGDRAKSINSLLWTNKFVAWWSAETTFFLVRSHVKNRKTEDVTPQQYIFESDSTVYKKFYRMKNTILRRKQTMVHSIWSDIEIDLPL